MRYELQRMLTMWQWYRMRSIRAAAITSDTKDLSHYPSPGDYPQPRPWGKFAPPQIAQQIYANVLQQVQVVPSPPVEYTLFQAALESSRAAARFETSGRVHAIRQPDLRRGPLEVSAGREACYRRTWASRPFADREQLRPRRSGRPVYYARFRNIGHASWSCLSACASRRYKGAEIQYQNLAA
jgi:hypothetical protein